MRRTQDSDESCPSSLTKLNLWSVRRLERLLGFPRHYLRFLAAEAEKCYSPFRKHDRARPFPKVQKPPKSRIIDNPNDRLKDVQRRINERLLGRAGLPGYMFGGVRGKSVLDNARMHKDAKTLVKIDIARFFPSVTNCHVYAVWHDSLGCSPRIASLLTRLTTFRQHLPQGAPSSTTLANLVLHSIDGPIRSECQRRNIRYSSWVDDVPFSSDDPRAIIKVVTGTLRRSGFRISRRKLEVVGPGKRKILNGTVLGAKLGIPQERLSRIRSGINKLQKGRVASSQVDSYVRSLRGAIAHVGTVVPRKAEKLTIQLEGALRNKPMTSPPAHAAG